MSKQIGTIIINKRDIETGNTPQGDTSLNGAVFEIYQLPDDFDDSFELAQGKEALRLSKVRVNQGFFRTAVLSAYNNQCAITRIANVELLNTSHIIPWRVDSTNRLNPGNGICLNALHDRAFDRGLITIDDDYRVVVSDTILNNEHPLSIEQF